MVYALFLLRPPSAPRHTDIDTTLHVLQGLQSHLRACHHYMSFDFLTASGPLPPAATLGLSAMSLCGVVVVRVPMSVFCRDTGRLLGRLERTLSAVEGTEGQAVVNVRGTLWEAQWEEENQMK